MAKLILSFSELAGMYFPGCSTPKNAVRSLQRSISLFLLTACSGEKGSHEQVSTVSIDKGVEHFDADYTSAQYQSLFKNPKMIRLETNDKCLLSANAYLLNVNLFLRNKP